MDKYKALELLKQALTEIPHLRELHYDNQEFKLWRDKVQNIIKAALDSDDHKDFDFVQARYFPDELGIDHLSLEENYLPKLNDYETAIKSIIQKYEVLGIKEKPVAKTQPKDIAETPVYLFDNLQFHPKVIEATRSCFAAGNYREAILNAFIALIDYVKEKTKLDTDTKDLMAKAFNVDKPVIKLNSLKEQYERDEQEGFRFLFMGASVGIRNPKAHKLIPQSNPFHALEYLAFASLLMRRVEEGKLKS